MIVILVIIIILMMIGFTMFNGGNDVKEKPQAVKPEFVKMMAEVNHDVMQDIVLTTNKYLNENTDLCTYIIETLSVEMFKHTKNNQIKYICKFMVMSKSPFPYGFSVDVELVSVPTMKVTDLKMNIDDKLEKPEYINNNSGHEFTDYEKIKSSELEIVKNKFNQIYNDKNRGN